MIKKTQKAKTAASKTVAAKAESAAPAPVKIDLSKTEPRPAPTQSIRAEPLVKAELAKPQAPATPQPPPAPAGIPLEFIKPDAKHVCVAGSFNEWQPDRAPLKAAGNGRWIGNLNVKPGRYEYLFVVDGQWLPDPNAKETVQNPFGGRNSVLTVSA